jgi:hypothetical protein
MPLGGIAMTAIRPTKGNPMTRQRPVGNWSRAIRDEIRNQGASAYSVAQRAGIDPAIVQRFVTEARGGIYLDTGELIANALGMRLVGPPRPRAAKPFKPEVTAA